MERSTGGMDQMENREPMTIDRFMYCPEVVITLIMEMEHISGQGPEEVGIMVLKSG